MPEIEVTLTHPSDTREPLTVQIADSETLYALLQRVYARGQNSAFGNVLQYTRNGKRLTRADLSKKLTEFGSTELPLCLQGAVGPVSDPSFDLSSTFMMDVSATCEAFQIAILKLEAKTLEGLLKKDEDIGHFSLYSQALGNYPTPLHDAISAPYTVVDSKSDSSEGQTPRIKCLQMLLEAKADLHARSYLEGDVLSHAMRKKRLDAVNFFIGLSKKEAATVKFPTESLDVALQTLSTTGGRISSDTFSTIVLLLENGANIEKLSPTCLRACLTHFHATDDNRAFKLIIDRYKEKADFAAWVVTSLGHPAWSPLTFTIEHGQLEMLREFEEAGVELTGASETTPKNTSLMQAVDYLIRGGASAALMRPVIDFLITKTGPPSEVKHGGSMSSGGVSQAVAQQERNNWVQILHGAAAAGELEIVQKLITAKVDPTIRCVDGSSVLTNVFRQDPLPSNLLAMTRFLVASTSDLSRENRSSPLLRLMATLSGRTPEENLELVQLVLGKKSVGPLAADAKAEPQRLPLEGDEVVKVLGQAIAYGDVDIVKELLGPGVEPKNIYASLQGQELDLVLARAMAKNKESFPAILGLIVDFAGPNVFVLPRILNYAAEIKNAELSAAIIKKIVENKANVYNDITTGCLKNLAQLEWDTRNLLDCLLEGSTDFVKSCGGPNSGYFPVLAFKYGLRSRVEGYSQKGVSFKAEHIIAMLDDGTSKAQDMQQWLASHIYELGIKDLFSILNADEKQVAADSVKRTIVKNEILRRAKSCFNYLGYAGLCLVGVGLAGSGSGLVLPGNNAHVLLVVGAGIALAAGLVALAVSKKAAPKNTAPFVVSPASFFVGPTTAVVGIGAIAVEMCVGTSLSTILATTSILVLGFVMDAVLTQLKSTQPKAAERRTVQQKIQLGLCLGMAGGALAIAGLGAAAICLPTITPELSYGLLSCAGVIALSLIGSIVAQQLSAQAGSSSPRASAI